MIETLKNPPINKTRQNLKNDILIKKDNTKSSKKYFLKKH